MFGLSKSSATVGALALLVLLAGCASTGPGPVTPRLPSALDPFLLDPIASYPLATTPEAEGEVRTIHQQLRHGTVPETASAAALALAERDRSFHPAQVLLAQIDVLAGHWADAVRRLTPVAAELPDYLACQMLLGHAAEETGEWAVAYDAFHAVAGSSSVAAERAAALAPQAFELVASRVDQALARGRVEDADAQLGWLAERAPDAAVTLAAQHRVAAAKGDLETELAVVRRRVEIEPTRELRERLGDLELEVGDLRRSLDAYERLVDEFPDDAGLAEKLERAKFRYRLELMPDLVKDVARAAELSRAELATLLYWLVPEVRYAQVNNPPIATDILDHPRREEIVRVMNLGLMTVDRTLHQFEPEEAATRGQTLAALLGLLGLSPKDFACLADVDPSSMASAASSVVCRKAAQCGLVVEEAECLSGASVSGSEALDLFRRTLDLLGSR